MGPRGGPEGPQRLGNFQETPGKGPLGRKNRFCQTKIRPGEGSVLTVDVHSLLLIDIFSSFSNFNF